MIQLFNSHFSPTSNIYKSISQLKGIGRYSARLICHKLSISLYTSFSELQPLQIKRLTKYIEQQFLIGSELHHEQSKNIQKIFKIRSYRGIRHKEKLPVRGQRTRTNAKTARRGKKI